MRDFLIARDAAIADVIDHTPRAANFFIDPTGEVISEVLQDEEGIAYAEIDLSRSLEPKQFHDVVGCYSRGSGAHEHMSSGLSLKANIALPAT